MKSQWYATKSEFNILPLKWGALLFFLFGLLGVTGCGSTNELKPFTPAKELYYSALISADSEFYNEAEAELQQVIEEHPGVRLATLAHLKLGDLYFRLAKWNEAELQYRTFLNLAPKHHLAPYVLNRLIALNYERSVQGVIWKTRDFDRDMDPNRKIVQNYQRFFLIYPQSHYLKDVKSYLYKAREDLAEYEWLVGNFYFQRKAFDSAILRYLHLLKHYPEYHKTEEVIRQLIRAYGENQQPHLAKELQEVLEHRLKRQLVEHNG